MGIYEATWEACKRWYGRCHKPHCITRQGLWLMLTGLPPNFQWTWLESLHSMDSLNQLDSWDVFSLAYPQKGDLFSTNKRCFVLGVSMGDAVSIGDQIHHQVPLPLQGWCELRRLGESCSILPRAPSINIHLPSQGRRKCASLRTFVQRVWSLILEVKKSMYLNPHQAMTWALTSTAVRHTHTWALRISGQLISSHGRTAFTHTAAWACWMPSPVTAGGAMQGWTLQGLDTKTCWWKKKGAFASRAWAEWQWRALNSEARPAKGTWREDGCLFSSWEALNRQQRLPSS